MKSGHEKAPSGVTLVTPRTAVRILVQRYGVLALQKRTFVTILCDKCSFLMLTAIGFADVGAFGSNLGCLSVAYSSIFNCGSAACFCCR